MTLIHLLTVLSTVIEYGTCTKFPINSGLLLEATLDVKKQALKATSICHQVGILQNLVKFYDLLLTRYKQLGFCRAGSNCALLLGKKMHIFETIQPRTAQTTQSAISYIAE